MKNALSLLLATLALSSALAGCTPETARPAQGSGDITIGAPGSPPKQMVCAPGSFSGGNECIPVKPAECPSGTILQEGECVAQIPSGEKPPLETLAKDVAAGALPLSLIDGEYAARIDPRAAVRQPRSRQLLITELQGLESLFQVAVKDSPDRPKIMYRLATDYVELEASVRTGRPGDDLDKRTKLSQAARLNALKYYRLLADQYPKFCASGPSDHASDCIDQVLYFAALEHIRGSDLASARKTLLLLIKDWPKSDKLGHAYFLFGELFLNESKSDPTKLPMAEQTYAKAAELQGPIKEAALTRLAETQEAQGNTKAAAATRAKLGARVAVP
ncbi:MAG: hypothetical protein U0441_22150 [Polyangiaceae bacterium]